MSEEEEFLDLHSMFHEKKFQCSKCPQKLITHSALLSHLKAHEKLEKLRCKICGYQSRSLAGFEQHQNFHVNSQNREIIECEVCHVKMQRIYLKKHTERYHPSSGDNFLCEMCSRTFPSLFLLQRHQKNHEKRFQCPKCPQKFAVVGELNRHFVFHQNPERLQCNICGRQLTSFNALAAHLKTHEEGFSCTECGRKCSTANSLNQHLKSHSNQKFRCSICEKIFAHEDLLKAHMKIHERIFPCQICGHQSTTKKDSMTHLISHGKNFSCSLCSLKFFIQSDLDDHKKFHENPEEFKCKTCGHQSSSSKSFKCHSMTHNTSRRSFTCDHCGFKTFNKKYLGKHFEIHKGIDEKIKKENSVKCERCRAVLKNEQAYKIHLTKRHGVKYAKNDSEGDFPCDECGKTFASLIQLKYHSKVHKIKCKICGKRISWELGMERHVKKYHQE